MSKPHFSRKREADWLSTTRRSASTAAEVVADSGGMSAMLSFGAARAGERVRLAAAVEWERRLEDEAAAAAVLEAAMIGGC